MFLGTGALQYLLWRIKCSKHNRQMLLCQRKIYDVLKQQSGVENIKSLLGLFKELQTCHGDIHKTHHANKHVNDLSSVYWKKFRVLNTYQAQVWAKILCLVTEVLESYKEL